MSIHKQDQISAQKLERKLFDFYQVGEGYNAFETISDHRDLWKIVADSLRLRSSPNRVRILEAGCGRTGFARFLKDQGLRDQVELHLHDITSFNAKFLSEEADFVYIGQMPKMDGCFEAVFSTYVFEHLVEPKTVLESWVRLLKPGGRLFIFSPRYDLPGYLNPSSDHKRGLNRACLAFWITIQRLYTLLTGHAAFLVDEDPSMFHLPWQRDRDAVHWVSFWDVKAELHGRGRLTNLLIPHGRSWRDYILKRWLTLAICFEVIERKPSEKPPVIPTE